MKDSHLRKGPGKGAFNIGKTIVTKLVSIVETRLRLAILELEEEKTNLIQILIMTCLTILFTAFGLISLMVLIILLVNVQYRFIILTIITIMLFVISIILGIFTLHKSRHSRLLRYTRKELDTDRKLL